MASLPPLATPMLGLVCWTGRIVSVIEKAENRAMLLQLPEALGH